MRGGRIRGARRWWVIPVGLAGLLVLGGGIPLYPPGPRAPLRLLDTHRYPSGMVTLRYAAGEAGSVGNVKREA